MATLKEIVEKYGYGCEVSWIGSFYGQTYNDIIQKSPLPQFAYRLTAKEGNKCYTDFSENADFQVNYVCGGDKVSNNNDVLNRQDVDIVDKLCSKALSQLKKEIIKDVTDYAENDLPELMNDILMNKGSIELNVKIIGLAEITQSLMNLMCLIDDYTYELKDKNNEKIS